MMMNRDLFKQETMKAGNLSGTLARLSEYFGKFWYMLLFVLVLISISTWTQVITPELTGQATDCFLVPLGNQSGSFGNFFGQTQSQNSASACWLGTEDSSTLSLAHRIIYKAYIWNNYPAPTNPGAMTNDQRIEGLFRLI